MAGSTFRQTDGATTARAVRVAAPCSGVVIEFNDFRGLTNATKITDNAVDTVIRNNTGG